MRNLEKWYQKNLALWAESNPKSAIYISYIDASHLTFCKTRKGELNLSKKEGGKTHYYHSSVDAQKEADQWFAKLNLFEIEALYVYGLGLGYYYDSAKAWLKEDPKRCLVFLEDDLAVIHFFFETDKATEILSDSQVKLYHFDNIEDSETVLTPLSELYWNSLTTKVEVSALRYYQKTKPKVLTDLHHKVIYDISMIHTVVEEYRNYGVAFYRNFYPNMLLLPGASLANGLFNKFRKVPAIICGAGPSLNKQLPLLQTLKDKALIFGGGSALNALNAFGMQPHFGAGVDPNFPQLERIKRNTAFEVPFLYRNRFYNEALQAIHAPRLYIAGSGGYDTSEWFEKKLNIDHNNVSIDEGFNVVNLCLSLAYAFGCDPIIFVGMDLAFTDLKIYANGILDNPCIDKKSLFEAQDFNDRAIVKEDIEGKPIYTLWKWIAESNWISAFAKVHPSVPMINATEGGLGFPDVCNQSFLSVIETHLSGCYDIQGWLHGEIQNHMMSQVTLPAIIEAMIELCESLERCRMHLDILVEEADLTIQKIKREKKLPANVQSGRAALSEIELSEELGYSSVLDMFNIICSKALNRDLQILSSCSTKMPAWKKMLKKLDLNNKKLLFLRNVAEVNMTLIKQTLNLSH